MIRTTRINELIGLTAAAVLVSTGGAALAQDSDYAVTSGGAEAFNLQIDSMVNHGSLAGAMVFNKTSGPGTESFSSVCTDVSATLFMGRNHSYASPAVFQGQTGIDPFWGAGNAGGLNSAAEASAATQAAADIFYKYGNLLSTGTSDQKAGVQLAVWAALYNTSAASTSISLNGSRFSVLGTSSLTYRGSWGSSAAGTQDAINDAQSYLAAVNFNDQYLGDLLIPDPGLQYGTQAQEVMLNVTPVPEPATMIAGAVLLLPFAVSTIRLRKHRMA